MHWSISTSFYILISINIKLNLMKVNLTKEEIKILKEKFIKDYSKKKGWNPKELTTGQMMQIISQEGFRSPKLL